MPAYCNSQVFAPHPSVTLNDDLHENTPANEYDLNSFLPPPSEPLHTNLVRVEPLIPILHADDLHRAFSASPEKQNPDAYFYPFPKGRPYKMKSETLIYMEKQRRRTNLLTLAITDLNSNELAGTIALGCDPLQASLDVKLLGVKIFPKFRGTRVFLHASYLVLSYALDPVAKGGLGLVRVGWRTPPTNIQSQKAAEKLGFSREGIMRCYEVSKEITEDTPFHGLSFIPDGTGRATEDGTVYSMTCYDWLGGRKREALEQRL